MWYIPRGCPQNNTVVYMFKAIKPCVLTNPLGLSTLDIAIYLSPRPSLPTIFRTVASHWNKERSDVFEINTEKSENPSSRWESNLEHLACAASALPLSYNNRTTTGPLPLSYNNRTTTGPHNLLYIYCTGGSEVPQSHTRQPFSMWHQNSVRHRLKNPPHQET